MINFSDLNFHDATIERVTRAGDNLTLTFDSVLFCGERADDFHLTFLEVTEERALIWLDDKAGRPHPQPYHPISEVMAGSSELGAYKFEGFSEEREWSEWWIVASGLKGSGIGKVEA